jgi:hypothetical protein
MQDRNAEHNHTSSPLGLSMVHHQGATGDKAEEANQE